MESFLWPATDAFIRFHDLPGREPALILIHGLGASAAQAFANVCRQAPLRELRCVAPDLLGFGHSDRPAGFAYSVDDHAASMVALLDTLGLQSAVVVGHSMGGAVAIALAGMRPDLVARLVLAEPHLDPKAGSVSGSVLARSESDFAQRGQAELVRLFVSQDHVAYAGAFKAADPAATCRSAASLVTPRRPTFREALLELPIPRDVLFGSRNAADPDIAWLPEHGIPVRVIPGAGHDIMTDQPAAFAAAVAEIVR